MQNSNEWIDRILTKLFEHEVKYIEGMVSRLNQMNGEAKNQKFYGFLHMGKKFIAPEYMSMRRSLPPILPTLAFGLLKEAEELTVHLNRLELDRSLIKQVLFKLLINCNTLQEIRDSLPECVVALLPELQRLKRENQDSLYLMRSDRYFLQQYEKILPKIEFYAMARMMY